MTIYVRVAKRQRVVSTIFCRSDGVLRQITQVYRRVAGQWRALFDDLKVTIATPLKPGIVCIGSECPLTRLETRTRIVWAEGGSGEYTYAWTYVSGDSAITIDDPSDSGPLFSAAVARNETKSAVWRCTVSDGYSSKAADTTISMRYAWEAA